VTPLEHAELLLRKAQEDETTLGILLANSTSPEGAIGFHAQQAIEKMLKAVLAAKSIRYPWRHDLTDLTDLLTSSGIPFPEDLHDLRLLTPFAVEVRYGDLPEEGQEPLDRAWTAGLVRRTREWAEVTVRGRKPADDVPVTSSFRREASFWAHTVLAILSAAMAIWMGSYELSGTRDPRGFQAFSWVWIIFAIGALYCICYAIKARWSKR
jgi:HEPN domain-containing protein